MNTPTLGVDHVNPENPQGLYWMRLGENPHVAEFAPQFDFHDPDDAKAMGLKSVLTVAEVEDWVVANPHPQAPVGAKVGIGNNGNQYRASTIGEAQ